MSIQSLTAILGAALSSACFLACSSDSGPSANSGAGAGFAGSAPAGAGASATSGAPGASGSSGGPAAGGSNSAGNQGSLSGAGGAAAGGAGAAGAAAGGAGGAAASSCTGNASYKISLDVTWNDAAVAGKHYTTIIGGVHSAAVSFWKLGGLATDGIKSMAEAGGTMPLATEVEAAISAGTAKSVIKFGGGGAPGKSSGTVELSPNFPQVSFGSMLAPTPDWFVGISGLSLCESGSWIASKTVDAVVYDAGTKDGAEFDYGFPETQPRAPIGYSVKFPGQAAAGSWRLEKL